VSNALRFDPPLVRALAAELGALLAGRAVHPNPVFDADLSATLLLDRGEALRWDLHPTRGWVRLVARPPELADRTPDARIGRVHAPDDERLLRIDLHEGNRFRGGTRALVVELHTNQWNALLVDAADRRIVSALRSREAGGRSLYPGEVYRAPDPQRRFGGSVAEDKARAEWIARLAPVPPPERRGALLRGFAGTSPINAAALLGAAVETDDPAVLEGAFTRWWGMRTRPSAEPVLLDLTSAVQPYPFSLDGVASRPFDSLLAAFDAAAEVTAAGADERERAALRARVAKRVVTSTTGEASPSAHSA